MKTHRKTKHAPKAKHVVTAAVPDPEPAVHVPVVAATVIPMPAAKIKDKSWVEKLFG